MHRLSSCHFTRWPNAGVGYPTLRGLPLAILAPPSDRVSTVTDPELIEYRMTLRPAQ